jgi:hypothetical protein
MQVLNRHKSFSTVAALLEYSVVLIDGFQHFSTASDSHLQEEDGTEILSRNFGNQVKISAL